MTTSPPKPSAPDETPRIGVVALHPAARLPLRGSELAAGWDLHAVERVVLEPRQRALVPTGLALALPPGLELQVRPRSGLALHHGVTVLNAPGTIDADYRGELRVLLVNLGEAPFVVEPGQRIAQAVVARHEVPAWEWVDTLEPTPRGSGGFGHTGS